MIVIPVLLAATIITQKHEWYHCTQDSDCVVVNADCGVAWAANKKFVEDTRKTHGPYSCTKPIEFHPVGTAASCEDKKCVLVPRGTYANGLDIP